MNTKLQVYPAVIVACLLGLVGLLLVWLRFSISIEPTPPETSLLPSSVPSQPHKPLASRQLPPNAPKPPPSSVPTSATKPIEPVKQIPVSSPEPIASLQGALRVSNQTDQPVRIALTQHGTTSASKPTYGNPAHWDFAPAEGSGNGLLLSLPDSNLKLKKGDILVAFAQDGSGRYWGPYVVGETALPVWNRQAAEWQLILK